MSLFLQTSSRGKPRGLPALPGFTLIELLVVSSIIVIITLVLLFRQSKFDSSTILRSVAYSTALSVRQAQVYGISGLDGINQGTVSYAPGYGIFFTSATLTSYVLFADFNNNGAYDSSTEAVKVFPFTTGYKLSEVCAKLSGGTNRCTGAHDSAGFHTTNTLTILFRRPNPDAFFSTDLPGESYSSVWVEVQSPDNSKRSVLITAAGQISVQSIGTLP